MHNEPIITEVGNLGAEHGVSVHAGFPNAAADSRLTPLNLNQLLIPRPSSTFLFRIRGEQGISRGIFDGDIAVVDRAATTLEGDLILWHDGHHFSLSARQHLAGDGTIWGVVTAVIHQYRRGSTP